MSRLLSLKSTQQPIKASISSYQTFRCRLLSTQTQGNVNQNSTSLSSRIRKKWGEWQIPTALGIGVIGIIQWQHLNFPTTKEREDSPSISLSRIPGDQTELEKQMATERQILALRMFPYRIASRIWGFVHDIDLPLWAREPMYKAWTYAFNCNLDEMRYSLESYKNLGEFFSRPLKDGIRPIEPSAFTLTSPVDGKIASIGKVNKINGVPLLDQVKGARYRMDDFLGSLPPSITSKIDKETDSSNEICTYQCVLYLAPGDYHRIHAPVDWSVHERRHFPGTLFPVNKQAANFIPSLFVANERVALLGNWKYGFFSLTAVGATNVGSILIDLEPDLQTNINGQGKLIGSCLKKLYDTQQLITRGDQMGQFKLGSTVVLVFEAPKDFKFYKKTGDVIRMGEILGALPISETMEQQTLDSTTFPNPAQMVNVAKRVTKARKEQEISENKTMEEQNKEEKSIYKAKEQVNVQKEDDNDENSSVLSELSSSITHVIEDATSSIHSSSKSFKKEASNQSKLGLGPAYVLPKRPEV